MVSVTAVVSGSVVKIVLMDSYCFSFLFLLLCVWNRVSQVS